MKESNNDNIEIDGDVIIAREEQMLDLQNRVLHDAHAADISYFDALNDYCQEYEIETEVIQNIISPRLMSLLLEEGEMLRTVKVSEDDNARLPVPPTNLSE